ncbi:uncharacterized protein DUF2812 [Aneurinibacillus soli]|uniref:Uncharacterized protein n=1 Tax=Aneurinibacillus soli TaxID=1500254 RepID=A0A0U4WIW7_9BACL|nr:DUF2812 domain-containing protein [Aneurinibacillus soli]PYE61637.1 uncharacterized protein DUF2812 [Aneurinibacillus soli]BAU28505.1 hypothetical protein CB4_02679 [Aneurinibacillus soli]
MKKFKWFVDIRKEEAWLNEQLKKGYKLVKTSSLGYYQFQKITDTNQVIKLDFQKYLTKEKLETYIELYEEFGWKRVAGSRFSSVHYWVKERDGHDELFSDAPSTGAMLHRMASYYFMMFAVLLILIPSGDGKLLYLNPKAAYLTPGLWERQGSHFVQSFLFETPFAFMRFGSTWLLIIMTLFFAIKYTKCKKQEKIFAE